MKILAFAGSNSEVSINKKLVTFAASFFSEHEVEIIDLNHYEMPIYKNEREIENGIPQLAFDFAEKIDESDLLLISLAEHNGSYSTAFKNIYDWVSRIKGRKAYGGKPVFLMAAAPGRRGGASVLTAATARLPFDGATVLETFSLPFFNENFSEKEGILNEEKRAELQAKSATVLQHFQ